MKGIGRLNIKALCPIVGIVKDNDANRNISKGLDLLQKKSLISPT